MIDQKLFAVGVLGWVMAGCAVQTEGTPGGELSDVKPEDGAEFEGNQFGSAQQGHALHYTDWSNQWGETTPNPEYKMGVDNPNCKDWYMYDRWVSRRPAVGWSYFSTWQTEHNWARGPGIDVWMNTLPATYTAGYKHILLDHNTVVARASGKCSGRYVFQMDNHTAYDFGANGYWFAATLPYWLMPRTKLACDARQATDVPSILVDLYACEAWDARSVAGSIGTYCGKARNNWRKVGSAQGWGWWNSSSGRCDIGTGVDYAPPAGKVAVSFNMVIKAGIGHGVAPAEIQIYRRY